MLYKFADLGNRPFTSKDDEMEEQKTVVENAHGLTYLFDDKPEPAEIREVAEGVHWLRLPLFETLDHINVWLLEDGDTWVIVDTGLNNDRTKEIWENVFDKTFKGKPVSKILVTHMHPDHIGLAGWMVDKFGVMLSMTRLEYLTCRVLTADTDKEAPKEALNFLYQVGVPDEIIEGYKSVLVCLALRFMTCLKTSIV